MKKLYTFFALLSLLAVFSCGDDLEIQVFDTPPAVQVEGPAGFVEEGGEFDVMVSMQDGATEELSTTPLSSLTVTVFDPDSVEVFSTTESVSGRSADVTVTVPGTLSTGTHTIVATATDTGGNSNSDMMDVEVIEKLAIGIIGDATPGGWETDTDLTRSESDPNVWTIEGLTLLSGEAKFRANDSWTTNWGADSFPTGVGTQDGPNIPVEAGIFTVTFNSSTGEYSFE